MLERAFKNTVELNYHTYIQLLINLFLIATEPFNHLAV